MGGKRDALADDWTLLVHHKVTQDSAKRRSYWVLLNVSRMAPFLEPTLLASESLLR